MSDPLRVANELIRFSKHTNKMIVGCMIGGDSMKTPQQDPQGGKDPQLPRH